MAITGIGNTYNNVYENNYISSKNEVTASKKKYTDTAEYYAYLKDKYSCLTASGYKVTISPAYLEKCISDPKQAELLEKNLAHLPASHQKMTAFWSAQGAEVVNEQWNFDENGNCGGGTDMYVTNKNVSSGKNVQDKTSKKKAAKKSTPQENYERKKQLQELFERKQTEKKQIQKQLAKRQAEKELNQKSQEKNALSRTQNVIKAMERYEASFLRS